MEKYSLENKPDDLKEMRKTATIFTKQMKEPFEIETQEGLITYSPETCNDWDDGYFLAYPSDGTKPYGISSKFIKDNYIYTKF